MSGEGGRAPLDAQYFKNVGQRRRHDDENGRDRRERSDTEIQKSCQRDRRRAEGFLTVPTPRSLVPDARRDRHGDDQARNDRRVKRGAFRRSDQLRTENDGDAGDHHNRI